MSVTTAPAAHTPVADPAAPVDDPTGWGHHASLDGVRTIAVYLVLAFHCGVGAVSGGFVGVDLFFVLSGFLVSSILLEEVGRTGTIRLGRFYARRVRRLLPAAVVVVVATSAASVLVLSSVRRVPLVGDAQSALLYFSNWRFLAQENDYFAEGVDHSPFLHFWSLSVEEQFYVAFPLVLLLLARLERSWRRATLIGITVLFAASVVAQVVWATIDATQAYYGTGARLYQLLAGVLAALLLRSRFRPRGPGLGLVAGVSLVCLLVVASGLVDVTPSWRGLLATVAAVSLILGLMGSEQGLVARALARPTPAYLGKISYGTYLWHWPVIILFGALLDVGPLALVGLAGVLATALAALSYSVLEQPIRRSPLLQPITWPVVAVGVALSVLVAFTVVPGLLRSDHRPALATTGAVSLAGSGSNQEGPVPSVDWEEYVEDRGTDDTTCTLDDADNCVIVDRDGPHVMLVGDSHARMIAPTLAKLARQHDFKLSVSLQEGCPWQLGVYNAFDDKATQERCAEVRDETFHDVIPNTDVDLVILSQIARDTDSWRDHLRSVKDVPGETLEQRLVRTIDDTLAAVTDAGSRALIIDSMLSVPWDQDAPLECLATATDLAQCRVPVPIQSPPTDGFYQAAAAMHPDVYTVNVNPIMCPAAPVCDPMTGDVPVWKDRKHYAPKALDLHSDEIWQALLDTGAFDGLDVG
ncbi:MULTISPECIES: acyltransferase family protein [unclassified Nocardioides]|uniref:acyltransferase family protein n=1 Tax=unclassified Nocardioides TaxID=2615069 RepID=UPI0036093E7A